MSRANAGTDASSDDDTADGVATRAAAEIRRQVEAERIGSLQALIPPTLAGGSLFACIAAVLLLHFAPHALVAGWLGAKLVIAVVRGIEVRRFRRASSRVRASETWRARLFLGLWADGLAWSALPLLFQPWVDALGSGLIVAATVGVVAIGTFSLSAHRTAATGFLAIVLGPLMIQQLIVGTVLSVATSLSLAIFAVVLLVECGRSHRRFSEMVKLRFENAAIAEQRQRALIYAEHSNAAKTRFLASVSHELRTPLNGILGMTQLMADESLSPMQQRSLQVVQHSAEHLVSVIGDLLDLSRIEMDRIALDPKPALLAQTVRDVADLLKPVALERGLVFLVAMHPSCPRVAVHDVGRVKQVLHNLIGNAIKFTAAGEIRVIVKLADPQTLAFEVRDTGEGVPPESIERIFEPFEQASALPSSRGGAGLGLTISRQLARAMGGDVTCRPAPGKGARFRFTMAYVPSDEVPPPRREPPAAAPPAVPVSRLVPNRSIAAGDAARAPASANAPGPARAAAPQAAAPSPPPDFADTEPLTMTLPPLAAPAARRDSGVGGRVLIVEDNEVNALVVRGMLDWLGVQSDRVTDGRRALDAMKAQGTSSTHPRYDLVLMDCQMPILDGWTATREWRQLERGRARPRPGAGRAGAPGRRLPIVALTASAAAGERERCLDAGMDDYLSKPFTREQLLEAIRPWLARPGAPAQSTSTSTSTSTSPSSTSRSTPTSPSPSPARPGP